LSSSDLLILGVVVPGGGLVVDGAGPEVAAQTHIGGPELGTGVFERLMREINARTDIGGVRWTPAGLRDTLTVICARILRHPAPPSHHQRRQPDHEDQ
jgi:hypothetical protein